ncbi:MAG: glycosyltransferase family 4 protein [Candidatus Moranbacteria bacterium]|nr:glycosyltransferase family 4 protein [Candidatus Moranbacteria bacterium]
MKILLINKFYYIKGGTEKHFFELKSVLEERGHEVIVFSTENKKNIKSGKNEYFIPELRMNLNNFFNGFKLFYNFQAIGDLKKIIAEHKIDIAHLHNISHHFSPAIIKVLKENNIPTVMTVHDYKLLCPNYKLFNKGKICEKCRGGKFYHCTLNKCVKSSYLGSLVITLEAYWVRWKRYFNYLDLLIAPSRFMQNKLIENGFAQEKVEYIPNFLDSFEQKNKVIGAKEKYILFSGRLSAEKGLDFLIKTFAEIDDKKLILKIAGKGEDEIYLKEMVRALRMEKRVVFLGHQSGMQIKKLIRESCAVVVPSVWFENAPYSILEAYAQTKLVIGSDLGGIPELIGDGKTGFIFRHGDKKSLAEKIQNVSKDPVGSEKMGMAGLRFLDNQLNSRNYYEKLMKVYCRAINLNGKNKRKKIDKNVSKC